MNKQYFPNREYECFSSSFANLLVELGDRPSAQKVFENYRNHPWVREDGKMHVGTATVLVYDLTDGKYQATLLNPTFKPENMEDLEELTRNFMPEKRDEIFQTILKEIRKKRIVPTSEIHYQYPALLNVPGTSEEICHWVVDAGDNMVIDNGNPRSIPYSSMGAKAVLVVKKVQEFGKG